MTALAVLAITMGAITEAGALAASAVSVLRTVDYITYSAGDMAASADATVGSAPSLLDSMTCPTVW